MCVDSRESLFLLLKLLFDCLLEVCLPFIAHDEAFSAMARQALAIHICVFGFHFFIQIIKHFRFICLLTCEIYRHLFYGYKNQKSRKCFAYSRAVVVRVRVIACTRV